MTDIEPITRWADLVMDWEIPDTDEDRFQLWQRHSRIRQLEMEIYGLPYKPLPAELHYWGNQ